MAKITEIRVHGVSGTPPRAMLRTDPRVAEARPVPDGEPDPPIPIERLDKRARRDRPVEVSFHPKTDPRFAVPADNASSEPDHVVAYNWSKLTSGRPRHALWLLLLPYTFMNAAGWMLPRRRHGDGGSADDLGAGSARALDGLVRVAGGAVTAVFVLFASAVTLDLLAAKCQPGTKTCSATAWLPRLHPGWWLFIGAAVSLAMLIVVGFWVGWDPPRRRQATRAIHRLNDAGGRIEAPVPGEPDPVASLRVTDTSLWHSRRLTRHLIWVHVGAAATALAWLLATIRWQTAPVGAEVLTVPVTIWVAVVASVIVAATLAGASFASHGPGSAFARLAIVAAAAGLVAFVSAGIGALSLADHLWRDIAVEVALSRVSLWTTALLGALGVAVFLVGGLSKARSTSAPAAMIVLAGLVGGSFGAGVYTLAHRILTSGREALTVTQDSGDVVIGEVVVPLGGMDWAALGFIVFVLATVLGVLAIMTLEPVTLRAGVVTESLRNVTTKARGLLGFAALVAFAGGLVFVVREATDADGIVGSPFATAPQATQDLVLVLALMVVLLAVVVVRRLMGWKPMAITAVILGAAYFLVASDRLTQINVLGVVVRLDTVRNLTVSLALLLPAAFVTNRMVTLLRDREQRRGIGILWDLGSFWQRWYHPFAAPTYAPVAVPDIAAHIRATAGSDDRVIVAAHSQGTVIAMAALLTFDPADPGDAAVLRRVGFLSYGSPIHHLYNRLFPAFFDDEAIDGLRARLDGERPRWRNLWRVSDPIGGDIPQLGADSVRIPDDDDYTADGHSQYERTTAFVQARSALLDAVQP